MSMLTDILAEYDTLVGDGTLDEFMDEVDEMDIEWDDDDGYALEVMYRYYEAQE